MLIPYKLKKTNKLKKVISLAWFESDPDRVDVYGNYIPLLLMGYWVAFPGYQVRLHTNLDLDKVTHGDLLRAADILTPDRELFKLVHVEQDDPLCKAMLWRLLPLFDDDVDYVFCREMDAVPRIKEREACEDFIKTGFALHSINDNKAHIGMMGGLCGFQVKGFREHIPYDTWDDMITDAPSDLDWLKHLADQSFLNARIWWSLQDSTLLHRFAGSDFTLATQVMEHTKTVVNDVPKDFYDYIEQLPGCLGACIPIQPVLENFDKLGYKIGVKSGRLFCTDNLIIAIKKGLAKRRCQEC